MAKKIKGITVVIGGDVTELDKALKSINKEISDTSYELKKVERALKLDPTNTILLTRKQELLGEQAEKNTKRFETMQKAFESVTPDDAKYAEWEKVLASIQGQMTKSANEAAKLRKEAEDLVKQGFSPDSEEVKVLSERADDAANRVEELRQSISKTYNEMNRPVPTDTYKSMGADVETFRLKMEAANDEVSDFHSVAAAKFSAAADTISDKAGKIASATKGVSLAAGGLLTGMLGSVKGTEEFRSDLSKLETNAKLAGLGLESTETAMRQLNAVSDETDSSVEALSNLLQAGVTESNLQRAVENLAGAAISFPDTIKIESLADSLQESLATGSATGQFAEVLARLGISVDEFNTQLSQVPGEANKLNFALDTLQNQGLAGVYNAWTQNNEALVENKDASLEFQKSLAKLGEEMQPLMTTVTELASSFLDWFNGLSDGQQGAIVALIAIVAALSPVAGAISAVSGALGDVADMTGKVEDGIADVIGFFLKNPMLGIVLGIATAVALIALNWDKVKEAAKKAIDAIVGFVEKGINAVKQFFGILDDSDSGGGKGRSGGSRGAGSLASRQGGAPLAAPAALLDDYPHFASGGLFAPNNPMLGVLGDNKTEYEVAAPESAIREAALDALSMSGLMGGQKISVDVHFSGTMAQFVRQLHPAITAESIRLGPNLAPGR